MDCFARRLPIICIMAFGIMVAIMTLPASAEESPMHTPDQRIKTACMDTESASGRRPEVTRSITVMSETKQQLHEARHAGKAIDWKSLRASAHELPLQEISMQAQPAIKEDAEGTIRIPSTCFSGEGDYKIQLDQNPQPLPGPKTAGFGDDVHVRGTFNIDKEINQSLAYDSQGNMYVAWQDTALTYDYIQLYRSTDGGRDWDAFGYVTNASAHLQEPCIAVGEGSYDRLVLTYIVDDGVNIPRPEVANKPLSGGSFTIASIDITDTWEAYRKPVIWTDSVEYSGWYAYLTCEGVYELSAQNINVCAWFSTSLGSNWSNQDVVLGNMDAEAWTDPDGSFGTSQLNSYIVCFNKTDSTLYTIISEDYGSTYSSEYSIATLGSLPTNKVDPEIAAAIHFDNVMVCCTRSSGGNDSIGQCYSTDAGLNWSPLYTLEGYNSNDEYAVSLTANEGGKRWHLAYTQDHHVMYSHRLQDLSAYWQSEPDIVNDNQLHSQVYTKKGIASNWDTDECGIAWADYRDGEPDYDTYFDSTGRETLHVPAQYATIQGAIDAAEKNDLVLVQPGRYMENIDFKSKLITVKSAEGAMWTIIDGQQSGSTVTISNSGGHFEPTLEGFTICNGSATEGGGIYCFDSRPRIVNNCIVNNWADEGAGIFLLDTIPLITFSTIYGNSASVAGGGIYAMSSTGVPYICNSIIWGNTAPSGASFFEDGSYELHVLDCDIQGGWPSGLRIIDADPMFVDESVLDLHLRWDSPCRDMAYAGYNPPLEDFEGDQRFQSDNPDMGADEFRPRFYYAGDPYPGGTIIGRLVGEPGATPVGFWIGGGPLSLPLHSNKFGDWFLAQPWIFFGPFGSIPADGVLDLPTTVPMDPIAPYEIYLQGFIEDQFTNLLVIRILEM